ncbi:thiopurine S-methyltransferase family protein [Colletotrichum costaricense]|uniref:Thiopurine S-methyltransferase family protein n=1 Tax=Colletotrichum costaricense TaxID=1209916 RepID=A0AAI9YFT7_9PEZI|nr:thiopurine S-methyltransferase family protein [Colletotrichum costaricense]KAK1507831.1 thiopurine S-methyltransferase family protein [Colletotrichum costaricense]
MAAPNPDGPARLITHFTTRDRGKQIAGWSELWDSDESDLWDRGKPSPALIDLIESRAEGIPRATGGRRPKVLVPGCGKGYDVVMLALHGFDVYGLEVSEKGAETARKYAETELPEPTEYNFGTPDSVPSTWPGDIKIISGDFFKRDWEEHCMASDEDAFRGFDLIYDYTFLCALLPEMRKDWAKRMHELLSPTGVLVCLEFPLYKDLNLLGPPWGLNGVYWNLLAEGGDGMIKEPLLENLDRKASAGSFKRVSYFKPPRSYKNGKGTDMVSVWARK